LKGPQAYFIAVFHITFDPVPENVSTVRIEKNRFEKQLSTLKISRRLNPCLENLAPI
jgi:hypothetical protein